MVIGFINTLYLRCHGPSNIEQGFGPSSIELGFLVQGLSLDTGM